MDKIKDTYLLGNGGRIKISETVLDTMEALVQNDPRLKESGGVLMGRFIRESKDLVIDKLTIPMKGDRQSRYGYKRLSPLHQEVIDAEWLMSKGTCNYLGEWHTHPEEDPEPSGVDLKDWKRKLKNDIFSGRYLYFIIAGTKKMSIWEADRRTTTITKLVLIPTKKE